MKDRLDAVKSRWFPRKNAEVKVELGLRYDASDGPAQEADPLKSRAELPRVCRRFRSL